MTKDDINDLAWMAQRYALGRMTYVVFTITDILIRNAKDIYIHNRKKNGQRN